MPKIIKATKLDILEFIRGRGMIEPWELRDHFGYSEKTVPKCLYRLKKQGLIIDMTKGMWELTTEGFAKLRYYRRR
jgi:uncharacterized membrane protein